MSKRTIHGIDPYAPGGIEALLAHHRLTFGNAVMQDPASVDPAPAGEKNPGGVQPAPDGVKVEVKAGETVLPAKTFDEAYVKTLRDEAAANRTKARDAETAADAKIKAALEALGIKPDEDPVKAAQAAAAASATREAAAQATARETSAELIVWRNAKDLGVNPGAITDSKAFAKAIQDLDPADPKFSEAVKAAATKAAETNPLLKVAPAAGVSGADFTGGTGEGAKKATTLEDAIAKKMAR